MGEKEQIKYAKSISDKQLDNEIYGCKKMINVYCFTLPKEQVDYLDDKLDILELEKDKRDENNK